MDPAGVAWAVVAWVGAHDQWGLFPRQLVRAHATPRPTSLTHTVVSLRPPSRDRSRVAKYLETIIITTAPPHLASLQEYRVLEQSSRLNAV